MAQDGEGLVAVVEAYGGVAEAGAVGAGVAVGEEGEEGHCAGGVVHCEVDVLEGEGVVGEEKGCEEEGEG